MAIGFQEIEGINTAIYTTLKEADDELKKYSQNYDDLSEAIKNTPMLQIYWQSLDNPSATDRSTFGGGERIQDLTFYVDLYLDQRSHVDKIFKQKFNLMNKIEKVFNAQNRKPYFGLATIKSFHWRVERSTFEYGGVDGQSFNYPGVRYTLDIRIF